MKKIKLSKTHNCLPLVWLLTLMTANTCGIQAQGHFTPSYTPRFDNTFHPMMFNTYYGTVSAKHQYRIVFTDGTDTVVNSMIHADTPSQYLLLENKAFRKKDSARFRRIYPRQTKYIARLDKSADTEYAGIASDSCWLFKVIDGKINAYSPLAEDQVDDVFIKYIQKDNGPLLEINSVTVGQMVEGNEDAIQLMFKKKFIRAIKKYNKSTN
jgi:hypothetical protein